MTRCEVARCHELVLGELDRPDEQRLQRSDERLISGCRTMALVCLRVLDAQQRYEWQAAMIHARHAIERVDVQLE